MRFVLVFAVACGGSKPAAEAPKPAPVPVTAEACVTAYAEYETRWREARTQELTELEFEQAEIDEMVSIEVSSLLTREDLAQLRQQYTAVEVFLPDAPWPRAFAAADRAIASCGESAEKPAA